MVTDFRVAKKEEFRRQALNCNNGLIFFDELTSGLDVEIAKLVTDSIKNSQE